MAQVRCDVFSLSFKLMGQNLALVDTQDTEQYPPHKGS